jgi:hypothetical protein
VDSESPITLASIEKLRLWSTDHGFTFIKFANFDADLLSLIASVQPSARGESFPFLYFHRTAILVEPLGDGEAMQRRMKRDARREIRAASRSGYRISSSCEPEALAEVWPLFERNAERKGFRYLRSLPTWLKIMRCARRYETAYVYVAKVEEQVVQALLVMRDGTTAEAMLTAVDYGALGNRPSPGVLIHWQAMQDFWQLGCHCYSFGAGPSVFKNKFNPLTHIEPSPVTMILNRPLYHIWQRITLPAIRRVWPAASRFVAWVKQA